MGYTTTKQVNVWRGSYVWHVANTTLNAGNLEPIIHFEALLGLLLDRKTMYTKYESWLRRWWMAMQSWTAISRRIGKRYF